ncbi:hypothetical protein PR202_ga14894 [Eleusine coracana subsp. coracana]|uniref:Uncharacterized protein n=1 Tax=Eleusine coracana subsp. coracana TaxID=191504 RepID=A0AAV5CIQ4_ELECO|nr:hypothetical protein PR202_ga14894 [Eleusine coracana subsp. coracana]
MSSCGGRRGRRCGRATRTGCGTSASGTSTGRRRSSSPGSMHALGAHALVKPLMMVYLCLWPDRAGHSLC